MYPFLDYERQPDPLSSLPIQQLVMLVDLSGSIQVTGAISKLGALSSNGSEDVTDVMRFQCSRMTQRKLVTVL